MSAEPGGHASCLCVTVLSLGLLKFVNSFARWQHLTASGAYFESDALVVSAVVVAHTWTAGKRLKPDDRSSPFVWRQASNSDYREVPVNFTSWEVGEPDNVSREQCIALNRARNYMWYDASCENTYNAVCEINLA